MKKWEEVIASDEFKNLPLVEREAARDQYFNFAVTGKLSEAEIPEARKQFLNYANDLRTPSERASSGLKDFGKGLLSTGSRVLGIGVGVVNSPLAFVWGSQAGQYEAPEEYAKAPAWKQALMSTGAGFDSAWRSISKEGDFGTLYNEYHKAVTGKTIEESLPDGLKWTAPTIEFIANTVTDPLFVGSSIGKLAGFKVPKEFIGQLPKELVDDINKINTMNASEKKQLQQSVVDILKNRKEYINWWEKTSDGIEELRSAKEAFKASVPTTKALPGGQGFILRKGGKVLDEFSPELAAQVKQANQLALPKAQGFELVGQAYRKEAEELSLATPRLEHLLKQETLSVEQIKEVGELQVKFRTLLKNRLPEKLAILGGQADEAGTLRKIEKNLPEEKIIVDSVNHFIAQPFNTAEALFKKAAKLPEEKAAKFLEVAELQKARALDTASKFLKTGDKRVEASVMKVLGDAYKPKEINMMRASGGAIAGIEQDENGNITYNLEKGIWGTLAVGAVTRLPKVSNKFKQTLATNPAWSKIHNMVGEVKNDTLSFSGALSKINMSVFDRFAPLKDLSEEGYKAARTFSSYRDKAHLVFNELRDGLVKVKNSEGLFTDYVLAHRAFDRARRGIANPNGVSYSDAVQSIKEMETHWTSAGQNVVDLKQSLVNFKEWSFKNILQASYENGILSKEAFDNIRNTNQWYAAFDVLEHLPDNINISSLPAKEYFSVATQQIIKTMKGTEKLIDNPIKATVKKFVKAQELFERNKVTSIIVDDAASQGIFRPLAESVKEFKILQAANKNPLLVGTFNTKEFDVVSRFNDGVIEKFVAPKFISDSLKQLTASQAPKWLNAINTLFRQSATTVYLPFTITNAFRDALMAYTTSPVYKTAGLIDFAGDWARGLFEAGKFEFLGKDKLMNEYIRAGGGFGYIGELRSSRELTASLFKKTPAEIAKSVALSPFTLLGKISSSIEMAPRFGVFERAKMMQFSSEDSTFLARKATIDFNRGGVYTKTMNQFIPFLNARTQSGVTVAESLKNNPAKTMSKMFLTVTLPGMALYAWNRLYYSKEYDDIPKDIRDSYFIGITGTVIENGKTKPKYITIPKGEVGTLAWNAFEYGLDRAFKMDRETVGKFLVGFLSDLAPISVERGGELSASKTASNFLPPVIKGAAENWANLNFYTGKEVVPYYTKQNKPPELQYNDLTPESYKWLGKKFNMSPLMIQNFAQNVLAGYGREGLDPNAMLRGLTGRLVKTTGGEINNRAWTSIKDIEQGYVYTRAYAEELIKNGERDKANQLLNEWNRGLQKQVEQFNGEFSEFGIRDKGGLIKSYRFDSTKRRNIFTPKPKQTGLEKKLTPRGR